jgi:hypothetical protein
MECPLKFSECISEGQEIFLARRQSRAKKFQTKESPWQTQCGDYDKDNRRTQGDNKNSFHLSVSPSPIRRESTLLLA